MLVIVTMVSPYAPQVTPRSITDMTTRISHFTVLLMPIAGYLLVILRYPSSFQALEENRVTHDLLEPPQGHLGKPS